MHEGGHGESESSRVRELEGVGGRIDMSAVQHAKCYVWEGEPSAQPMFILLATTLPLHCHFTQNTTLSHYALISLSRPLSLIFCLALLAPRHTAAHFANVTQPSPLFSQERAPTSVAYAENQSMVSDR